MSGSSDKVCLSVCGSRLLLLGLKPMLQLVLLLVFLKYFGLPAVEEYRASKVMVVESRKASGGIPAGSCEHKKEVPSSSSSLLKTGLKA